jgi:hypothetical protein
MFKILHTYGNKFQRNTWQMIFRGVLFPMFDDVTHAKVAPRADKTIADDGFTSESWLKACQAAPSPGEAAV